MTITTDGTDVLRPPPSLVATEVSFGYGALKIVDEVSLQVGPRETVVLLGPNGAGKSTFVKGVIGQLPLLSGSLHLHGQEIGRRPAEDRIRRGVGYVPQIRDVFPTLSVWENLEMGAYMMSGRAVRAQIATVLETFPVLASMRHRRAGSLSGGERKMLGIARAMMATPKVLILDEPTSNLAPNVAARVLREVVAGLSASGQSVLMIEQRVEMALEVATWGYVLTQGRLRLAGSAASLRDASKLGELFFKGGAPLTVPNP